MARYNWDIENLVYSRKQLYNKLNDLTIELDKSIESRDYKKIKELKKAIDSTSFLISFYADLIDSAFKKHFNDDDYEDMSVLERYEEHNEEWLELGSNTKQLAVNIINDIVGLIPDYFDKSDSLAYNSYHRHILYTNEDLITIAHDFFEYFDPKHIDIIDNYLSPKNKYMSIQYLKSTTGNSGITVAPKEPDVDSMFAIYRSNTYTDLLTIVHELGHIYGSHFKNTVFNVNSFRPISEAEGRLPEYLFLDYSQKYNIMADYDITLQKDLHMYQTIIAATSLFLGIVTLETANKGEIDITKIQKSIDNCEANLKVCDNVLDCYSKNSFLTNTCDIISDLTALDLTKTFNTDPERVRYVFNKFGVTNPKDDELLDTLDKFAVTFHRDDCQTFKNKVKEYKRRSL